MIKLIQGDCLGVMGKMDAKSINCCVTSPPYFGLRDYGHPGQIGLEETPDEFVKNLVNVFREVKRVLKDDGTLWLNLGDSYAGNHGHKQSSGKKSKSNKGSLRNDVRVPGQGLKQKDLIGIPWRVAFALQSDGWYLRQDIIWNKPNPMPESVKDRCTKSHEYIFLLSKSAKYYFDHEAIKEPAKYPNGPNSPQSIKSPHGQGFTRSNENFISRPRVGTARKELRSGIESRHRSKINGGQSLEKVPSCLRSKRSVWTISTKPFKAAHFATFPPDLIEPCILAGCPENGVVLDPFVGAGTVPLVSCKNKRNSIGIDLNKDYLKIAHDRVDHIEAQISF